MYRKKDGSSVVKSSTGKIVNNIPSGRNVPSQSPGLPMKPAEKTLSTPDSSAYEKRMQRQAEIARHKEAIRHSIGELTDAISMSHPDALTLSLDDDFRPTRVEDRHGNMLIDLQNAPELRERVEQLALQSESMKIATENGFLLRENSDSKEKSIFLLFKCPEDQNCNFRSAHHGIAPSHTASEYCQSGRRAHCTCDTCF
jgi:hypothetical protein